MSIRSVGFVGYGAFARLAARHLAPHFQLRAFDPATPASGRDDAGVRFGDIATIAQSDAVLFATPVETLEAAIDAVAPHLRAGSLVLDVGSVKVAPAEIMLRKLPAHVDIVATHPLFGPQSARNGLQGLKIALCPLRGERTQCVADFLKSLGLEVIITDPEAHDREAAVVQGLTHLIAKVMVQMEPLPTQFTTTSYDLLMQAVAIVRHDPPAVFEAIERDNPYAAEIRARFIAMAQELDRSFKP